MAEDPTFIWAAVQAALMAIPAFGAALWGGLGAAIFEVALTRIRSREIAQ